MTLGTKEHDELMAMFEKEFSDLRLDREPRADWRRGIIYQSGETNKIFLAYRRGYAYGVAVA